MSKNIDLDKVVVITDAEGERIHREGREALEHLKKDEDWKGWVKVGLSLERGRQEVLAAIGDPNRPNERAYRIVMGHWLKEHGYDEIDKGTRSRLISCMKDLKEIEEWRAKMQWWEQNKLNHPTVVWNRFQARLRAPKNEDGSEAKPLSPMAKLKATVDDLVKERDELQHQKTQLMKATGVIGANFDWTDTPETIAGTIYRNLPAGKFSRLATEMMKLCQDKKQKPKLPKLEVRAAQTQLGAE